MYFEDFAVGQSFTSPPRQVTQQELASFGPAVAAAVLVAGTDSDDVLREASWRYLAPIHAGDTLVGELTVTGCRRSQGGHEGTVRRHVVVRNQRSEQVQEGTSSLVLHTRGTGPDPVGYHFGTVEWGRALAERATHDAEFTSATATWDGTIGLRCGTDEVQLRIYRGSVIDVTRRTPLGATFTFGASELVWTQLIAGESNDFMRRVMAGEFEVSGNGYEYLRLTKVLGALIDNARALARDGVAA